MTTTRTLLLLLALAFTCSLATGQAHAAVFTPSNGAELQKALDTAVGTVGEPDEIQLGPGVYSRKEGFHYFGSPNDKSNRIEIKGTPGQTILEVPAETVLANNKVLELHGTGAGSSYVHGVKVRVPLVPYGNNFIAGIVLEHASAVSVVVEPDAANGDQAAAGVMLWDGSELRASQVQMPGFDSGAAAVVVSGASTKVEDVQTAGGRWGIRFDQFGDGYVRRARVDARKSIAGIVCDACDELDVDDSAVRVADTAVGLLATGHPNRPVVLDASYVTVVGEHGTGIGAAATADLGTKGTILRVSNCVLWDLVSTLYRYAESGTYAQMVTRNCDYPAQQESGKGAGTIDAKDNISVDPEFVYPGSGDFRLKWSSGAIDAGRAAVQLVDSPFALDHSNRITDGDLNGEAHPDMGANEYQAHPPKIGIQPPPALYANEPFTLDASKSGGGDPGEPVKFNWALPGGATADTPTVGLELPAGKHEVTLIVTDPTGKTATEHRTLDVVKRPATDGTPPALLSGVRVSPARVRRGSMPKLTFALASRATVSASVQRRAGGQWRRVKRLTRTLGAGRRGMKLPRANRGGRWRVIVAARAGAAKGTARAGYRVRR